MDDLQNHSDDQDPTASQLATPTVRLFAILEAMSRGHCHFTLQEMVQETGIPKPTVYRMLQQLESAGILQRDGDERHYGLGSRLRQIANGLLLNDSLHGARHRILQQLREAVGESCNLTALSAGEVVYLDRVETSAPLRFYLHPGSRVPVHCSATGKLFLSQMPPRQRHQLLGSGPLEKLTTNTLTELSALDAEIERCRRDGYAVDNEEFLPGLVCLAVLVPSPRGKSNLGVAMQGPALRLSVGQVERYLPHLRRAADALARLEAEQPD
ncbi:MAG: IclR family transcriptional regulator [Lautropia sp.]|nr:IclR family transcriptional regulator [Lautropia sp.]